MVRSRLFIFCIAVVNGMQMSCGHNKCAMTQELHTICEGVKNIKCDRNDVKHQKRTCQDELNLINDNEIELKQNNTILQESKDQCIQQLNSTQDNINDQTATLSQTLDDIKLNCSTTTSNLVSNLNSLETNYTDLTQIHSECVANLTSQQAQMASLNVGTKLGFGSLLLSIVASFGLLAIGGGAGFMWARRKYNKQSVVVMENNDGGANISKTKPNQCRKEPPKWHSMQNIGMSALEQPRSGRMSAHSAGSRPQQIYTVLQSDGYPMSFAGPAYAYTSRSQDMEQPPSYDSDEEYEMSLYNDRIRKLKNKHKIEKQQHAKELE